MVTFFLRRFASERLLSASPGLAQTARPKQGHLGSPRGRIFEILSLLNGPLGTNSCRILVTPPPCRADCGSLRDACPCRERNPPLLESYPSHEALGTPKHMNHTNQRVNETTDPVSVVDFPPLGNLRFRGYENQRFRLLRAFTKDLLEASWAVLEASWKLLGPCWAILRPS